MEVFLLHARFLPFYFEGDEALVWEALLFIFPFLKVYIFPSLVPQEHSFLNLEGFIFFSFTCSTGTSCEGFLHKSIQCHWLVLSLPDTGSLKVLFFFPSFAMHGVSPALRGRVY